MLRFLSIKNFALVESLEVEFSDGLNLITGETGSGKSILVDAVGLLAGGRASQDMVRHGFDTARVEGVFVFPDQHPVQDYLSKMDIDEMDEGLIVRREVSCSGQNKVFINGVLSTQRHLSELGMLVADIHGQHDQQLLLRPSVQLQFLDAFGCHIDLLKQVSKAFYDVVKVRRELQQLQENEQDRLRRLDMMKFQISEIQQLNLKPGLDLELEEERALLASSEKRQEHSRLAYRLLYADEGASLTQLSEVEKNLVALSALDQQQKALTEEFSEMRYRLEDMAFQLREYMEQIEFSSDRLDYVQERLADIQKARRKYGETVNDILAYGDKIQDEIAGLQRREERIACLETDEKLLANQFSILAQELSRKRHSDATTLSAEVENSLASLNMDNTVFATEIHSCPASEKGTDNVEFLISPNPGEVPKPLARIASGGELSRVVLVLRALLSFEPFAKTIVFDEVDAGIGGRVAAQVGERLAHLAEQHQVFCVTHLPQIASFANSHFHVDKHQHAERTIVQIKPLAEDARVDEIARMMAGNQVTDTTRKHAAELLEKRGLRKAAV